MSTKYNLVGRGKEITVDEALCGTAEGLKLNTTLWTSVMWIIIGMFAVIALLGFGGSLKLKVKLPDGTITVREDALGEQLGLVILFMIFMTGVCWFIHMNFSKAIECGNSEGAMTLAMWFSIIISLFLSAVWFGYLEYNKKNPDTQISFMDYYGRFLFGDGNMSYSFNNFIQGLGFGLVFGFIDNFGLATGMDALDPYTPGFVKNGADVTSAYGNTFSDFIGAFVGTFFVSLVMGRHTDTPAPPLSSDVMGVTLGCMIGLGVAKLALPVVAGKPTLTNNITKYVCAFGFLCMCPIVTAAIRAS